MLAIAILGVIMFASFSNSLDNRLAALDLPPDAKRQLEAEKLELGAAEAPASLDAAPEAAVERAVDEAFVSGYRVVMLVAAATAVASAVGVALLIEGRKPEEEVGEPKAKTLAL